MDGTTLRDQVVVITGAGTGLGRALATGFAERGASVVGLGRHEPTLQETASLAASRRFAYRVVDVAESGAVTEAIGRISDQFGRIDVLINNAAIYPKVSFLEQDAESWMKTIAVNLGGVANCCRAVLPLMMQRGSGRIINIGSFADRSPIPCSSAYAASKGGLHALTKAIAADLGDAFPGIAVVEWIPGHLRTQMSGHTGMDPAVCVEWAVKILGFPPARGTARVFEEDREHLPPRSLKARLAAKLGLARR